MQPRILIIAIVVAVLVLGGLWWWFGTSPDDESTPLPAKPPEQVVEAPLAPQPGVEGDMPVVADTPLPPLEESDTAVRSEVLALAQGSTDASAVPALSAWLEREELIRRFAVVADNASKGNYPWRQLSFLAPTERLPVIVSGERIELDPKGYVRFDSFVDTVLAVPPAAAAKLLERYSPLIGAALLELGEGERDPVAVVRTAVEQALATPVIEGPIELTQPKVFYQFADPELEALPPLQKQLLRMGPDNLRRLKAYLAELEASL